MPRARGRRDSGCGFRLERELDRGGYRCVAGIDEAGRGALFGPVVAAVVILPGELDPRIDDSKKLRPALRRELALKIMKSAHFAVASASCDEIDRWNIRVATMEAMKRAVSLLDPSPDFVLVDGHPVTGLDLPHRGVVGGDALSYSIAAASILAKVQRDYLMDLYGSRFPCYNLAKNKGYGTQDHIAAIRTHGLTSHHRRSFCRWFIDGQMSLAFG